MAWQQVRAFSRIKAGTVVGLCLQNVRKGYDIGPVYPSAISAWDHTVQHKDRNIPLGVDVPLFYSWLKDGHINVRLANGAVWNDGRLYGSLGEFEANTAIRPKPVFLGWGESVNNVRVVQEDEVSIVTDDFIKGMFKNYWGVEATEKDLKAWRGTNALDMEKAFADSPQNLEWKRRVESALNGSYQGFQPVVEQLYRKVK